ncbi:MAG: hypothetical protein KIS92_10885, partial [Planctomycetota bacterium]|nr:hypothetical protein [Planctomycetota bacterium]
MGKPNAPVLFPSKGTPPDRYGYPHYQAIGEANQRFRGAYLRELRRRRAERARVFAGRDAASRWTRRVQDLRKGLTDCLGLSILKAKHVPVPARFVRATPLFSGRVQPGTPAWAADLRAYWYELPSAGWDDESAELLVLRPMQKAGPYPGLLLIPDAGACMFGAQSPESAARALGCALAAAGFLVAIPKLTALQRFSSTHNKRRVLEGSCATGEVVAEAARALDALLALPGLAGRRAFAAGVGLGGL